MILQRRVLIAAQTAADAEILLATLADAGIEAKVCSGPQDFCESIKQGAGAAVIAQEFLSRTAWDHLTQTLSKQPEWSDFPLIILVGGEIRVRHGWRLLRELEKLAHVVVLERPVRKISLFSSVHAALQSRRRQYQVRDELARREEAERDARRSEERLRLAQQVAQVGSFEWDIQANVDEWSPELEEIYGLRTGGFDGTYEAWAALVHPDDLPKAEEDVRESLNSGRFESEWRVVLPDGSTKWLAARGKVFKDDSGRAIRMIGVNVDITKRKEAEEALRESDRRKDVFLATLAHELRNPLAPIRTGLELINIVQDDPVKLEKIRRSMERQADQLVVLVDDLLDVSRITRGKFQLRRTRLPLSDVIESALEATKPLIESAAHELVLEEPEQEIEIDADPNRLTQILVNLLSNAAKYTPEGGRVRLRVERRGRDIVFSIQDNGIGIPSEMQQSIFEMFAQIPRSDKAASSGLGIGLTLVKSLVEMHGGTIDVHSEGADKGTEFRVKVPIVADAPKQESSVAKPEHPQELSSNHRVLVVDDNQTAAHMLSMILEAMGNDVETANDGREAIDVASRFHPDLVLMDLGMPGMDGYEAARRIRRLPWAKDARLVALSGWGQDSDKMRAREAGFDHYLVKPAGSSDLKRILSESG